MLIGFTVAGVLLVVALILAVMLNGTRRRLALIMVKEVRATQRSTQSEDLALRRDAEVAMARAATQSAEERIADLQEQLEAARAATAEAEAGRAEAADAATERVGEAQAELAATREQLESAEVKLRVAERRVAATGAGEAERLRGAMSSMWDLAELHQDWVRRAEAELSTAPDDRPEFGLDGALELEVARTREETGTPGRLTLALDGDPGPQDALLILRALQALLTAVARRCDSYELDVRSGDAKVVTSLRCSGFDGGSAVVDDARTLGQVLSAAGVEADVEDGDHEALSVRLAFPVTPHR